MSTHPRSSARDTKQFDIDTFLGDPQNHDQIAQHLAKIAPGSTGDDGALLQALTPKDLAGFTWTIESEDRDVAVYTTNDERVRGYYGVSPTNVLVEINHPVKLVKGAVAGTLELVYESLEPRPVEPDQMSITIDRKRGVMTGMCLGEAKKQHSIEIKDARRFGDGQPFTVGQAENELQLSYARCIVIQSQQ